LSQTAAPFLCHPLISYQQFAARTRRHLRQPGQSSSSVTAREARIFANDNISEFIEPEEIDELLNEVAGKMIAVLESLVIDIGNDHNTHDTARRVAKIYLNELFRGRYVPAPPITSSRTEQALRIS
jgi:hypothetical protein